ncbi:rRNA methyltransferase [Rhodospirillum rubrum]|uniref:tRNA (cytidine(34)-2'-O)-methyltransferase n=1 Tax=Rhodospirillum rubrum TaxID=1085 RepID=UPI0019087C75|nr:tRNA (cytidine(34)-2'-O)-methyltransferase [Rhodospirillum rubrum]MBK1663712.1 rRNA methyltransferase [Rhodospirillum rubrum]MBK1676463.1 rRNA methyltransferase [Rhodospirillum rubrum]
MVRLALYQPDIPQNAGTILRLGACLGVEVDLIEPCGFVLDDRRLRRAGMDYLERAALVRHSSWSNFVSGLADEARLILLTTQASAFHAETIFQPNDVLLLGRESAGVPPEVHERADLRIRVPMVPGVRSLNIAVTAALVLGEALRQTASWPQEASRGELL